MVLACLLRLGVTFRALPPSGKDTLNQNFPIKNNRQFIFEIRDFYDKTAYKNTLKSYFLSKN
jgi:hypothetical protein